MPAKRYADHPRYGNKPRITGLNPEPGAPGIHLHWNATSIDEIKRNFEAVLGRPWPYGDLATYARPAHRISNTAVAADLGRQSKATVAVTHYFDIERGCRDCGEPFIFFAEEQKHWYEELGFGLDSDCVRCVACRKRQQGEARRRQRYEELFREPHRTEKQTLEMIELFLALTESGAFGRRRSSRIRALLNILKRSADAEIQSSLPELSARVNALEDD
ncbi:MAG TPA: zinc-ribbon domain-containing protein [Terriglobia bacterium]|nr:zinc-ribbon domain-containing protein [Terriglobia bacterium]